MAEADYLKQVQTEEKNNNDQNVSKPTIPCLMLPSKKLKNKLEKMGCFTKKENQESHEQIYIQQIQLIQLSWISKKTLYFYLNILGGLRQFRLSWIFGSEAITLNFSLKSSGKNWLFI